MTTILILAVLYFLFILYILYSYYLDLFFLPLAVFFISYFIFPGGYGEVKVIYSIILAIVIGLVYLYLNYWRKKVVAWQVVVINIIVSLLVVTGMSLFNYYQPDLANLHQVSIRAAFSNTNVILYSLICVILCPIVKLLILKRRLVNKRLKLINQRKSRKEKLEPTVVSSKSNTK